ncbi:MULTISPECIES: hypothetical protein [Haloferacaceae]|uniref:Uncharacterized protein n=1 Tax=Halorubrum glutamatedens TaxID=2707018 RepID=A0ABD5QN32_9EURY|nr:hypothetical protein [Halobellus captivus]
MSTRVPLERIPLTFPLAERMSRTVRAVAFWAAIVIPVGYPFLLYAGLDRTNALLFVGLLAANAVALAVGHDYHPSSSRDHGVPASSDVRNPSSTSNGGRADETDA